LHISLALMDASTKGVPSSRLSGVKVGHGDYPLSRYIGSRRTNIVFAIPCTYGYPDYCSWGRLVIRPLLARSSPVTWVTCCMKPLLLWNATILAAVLALNQLPYFSRWWQFHMLLLSNIALAPESTSLDIEYHRPASCQPCEVTACDNHGSACQERGLDIAGLILP
jgi:hypothetical protein